MPCVVEDIQGTVPGAGAGSNLRGNIHVHHFLRLVTFHLGVHPRRRGSRKGAPDVLEVNGGLGSSVSRAFGVGSRLCGGSFRSHRTFFRVSLTHTRFVPGRLGSRQRQLGRFGGGQGRLGRLKGSRRLLSGRHPPLTGQPARRRRPSQPRRAQRLPYRCTHSPTPSSPPQPPSAKPTAASRRTDSLAYVFRFVRSRSLSLPERQHEVDQGAAAPADLGGI